MDYFLFNFSGVQFHYTMSHFFTFYFRSTFISFFVSKSIRKRNAFFYVSLLLQRKKEPCLRTTLFDCLLSLSYQWYFSPLLILKAR